MADTTSTSILVSELWAEGFRKLRHVRFSLHPLSVLIGANGTGKTTVLDALGILAESASGRLSATLGGMGGVNSLLTADRAERLRLGIRSVLPQGRQIDYGFSVRPQGISYDIAEETLRRTEADGSVDTLIDSAAGPTKYFDAARRTILEPGWDHLALETSLSQVPKSLREAEEFRRRLASAVMYHELAVDPRAPVRLPQPLQPAVLPGRNGEDLVSCLFNMSQSERHRFEAVEDALRTAFPRFQRLEFPPVAAGTLALGWREEGSSKPFYMHQLSEGTLRFLWLATLLQSPGIPALTLIDEPEVSLHPELLKLLADLLREASRRSQIVVATHSDSLIRFLEPSEIIVMNSDEEGMTSLTRADELDLQEWLNEYTLDELWRNGRLGARA